MSQTTTITPAAPAAPATLTTVPTGHIQGEATESAVDRATREARERVAAGQPLMPPGKPAQDPKTGQFVEASRTDVAREIGSARQAPPPPAGQGAPAADPAPVEGEEAPAAPEPLEGAGAAEAGEEEAPPAEQPEVPEDADDRIVTLVGRNGEEFELELPPDTPREAIDAVRGLRNGFMRGEAVREANREIEQRAEVLAQREIEIEMDPVGHMLSLAEENPVIQLEGGTEVHMLDHLVLSLVTQPKVWERLKDRIEAIATDENERRITRAEMTAQRSQLREEVRGLAETRAQVSRNLQDVQATVAAMLPTTMSGAQQQVLYRDALRDLKEYADRHRLMTIPVKDIPAILAARLTAYGINPVEAATRAAESATRRAATTRRPAAPAGRGGAPAAPARPAPPTAQRFVASAKKRTSAGSIPPAGAGSPSATAPLTPPKNPDGSPMSIEQRLAWHRQELQKGVRRY